MKQLLDKIDVNAVVASEHPEFFEGATLLHIAARGSNPSVVEVLLAKGADPTKKTRNGWTPLFWALNRDELNETARNDARSIVTMFAVDNRSINEQNSDEGSPLHFCASLGLSDHAEVLVNHGADLNSVNMYGQKPFEVAIENGFEQLARSLNPLNKN